MPVSTSQELWKKDQMLKAKTAKINRLEKRIKKIRALLESCKNPMDLAEAKFYFAFEMSEDEFHELLVKGIKYGKQEKNQYQK